MRLDHVRNVDIWKEAHMYPMAEFLREKRLNRNQMTTEMAEDRKHWHVMIQAGTLQSVEADR